MRKFLNYIILSFLFTIILHNPLSVSAGEIDDGYYIKNYHVDIVANDDRTFDITETIDVFFNEERRGIIRNIDLYGAAEELWFADEVKVTGAPFIDEGNGLIKIGDADAYVEGDKRYIIEYTLDSYAEEDLKNDYLYLDVIGTGWGTNIDNFSGTITLPKGAVVEDINLTAGSYGYTSNDIATAKFEKNVVTISQLRGLSAFEGVTINVKMNEGAYPNAKKYEAAYTMDALDIVASLDENGIFKMEEKYTITKNNENDENFYRDNYLWTNTSEPLLNSYEVVSDEVYIERIEESSSGISLCLHSSDIEVGDTVSFVVSCEYILAATDANPIKDIILPVCDYSKFTTENINVQINTPVNIHLEPLGKYGEDQYSVIKNNSKQVEFELKGTDRTIGGFCVSICFDEEPYVAKMQTAEVILIIVSLVLALLIAVITFIKKDRLLVEVISYYPPKDVNPAELGYIIDENCTAKDISSILYYWAAKGYINIEFTEKDDFIIHKLRDLEKFSRHYEKIIFKKLWKIEKKHDESGDYVSSEQLKKSYLVGAGFKKAVREIEEKYKKKNPIYDNTRRKVVIGCSVGYIMLMTIAIVITIGFVGVGIFIVTETIFVVGTVITIILCNRVRKERYARRIGKIVFNVGCLLGHLLIFRGIFNYSAESQFRSITANIIFITSTVAVILLQLLYKRTKLGNELLGQALGFKRFLTLAKKEELETLIDENPNYYYDILPYANVLNVSNKWSDRFAGISIGSPTYIYTSEEMNERELKERIIRNYNTLSASVINSAGFSPSSSGGGTSSAGTSSGGGFSGGGFSGGGGGGGGGSSW